MRWLAVWAGLALGACATPPPPPGTEVRMEMLRPAVPGDVDPAARFLTEAERRGLRLATGLRELAYAGRVMVARCALARDELVFALAVLPEGQAAADGEVWRVRLGDRERGQPDRAVGRVVAPPGLARGSMPRTFTGYLTVMPWSTVPVEGEADPFVEAQYFRVRGYFVVRCVEG